jgi:hypothetical protein
MMSKIAPLTLFAVAMVAACAGTKRSPQAYRVDTRKALETRSGQIKSCYDELLEKEPAAAGTVTVRFVVEKETGAFAKAAADPSKSTAREPLVACVLDAIHGLKLDPPDANEGQATFSYELGPSGSAM